MHIFGRLLPSLEMMGPHSIKPNEPIIILRAVAGGLTKALLAETGPPIASVDAQMDIWRSSMAGFWQAITISAFDGPTI